MTRSHRWNLSKFRSDLGRSLDLLCPVAVGRQLLVQALAAIEEPLGGSIHDLIRWAKKATRPSANCGRDLSRAREP